MQRQLSLQCQRWTVGELQQRKTTLACSSLDCPILSCSACGHSRLFALQPIFRVHPPYRAIPDEHLSSCLLLCALLSSLSLVASL